MASYLSKLQHFRWNWCEITPSALCLDVEWFFNRLNIRFTEIATTSILSFVSTTWMKGLVDRTVERSQKMNQLPKHIFEKFSSNRLWNDCKRLSRNFSRFVLIEFRKKFSLWKISRYFYDIFDLRFSESFPSQLSQFSWLNRNAPCSYDFHDLFCSFRSFQTNLHNSL